MKNKCMTYLLCLMTLLPATYGLVASKNGIISVGTIQVVTFGNTIAAPETTCSSLLKFTAGDLGTSPVCSISWIYLIIKMGDSMTSGTPTITLISGGFTDGLAGELTFTRMRETTFSFSTGATGSHYQDYVNNWTVQPANTNGGTFTYTWTYASDTEGPSLPASGTTLVFDFNYWQATIDQSYSIAVNMTDDNNAQFYYASTGGVFTVLDSCASSCDTVTWTMTNDPGTVSSTCTSGQGGDTVSCTKAGSGPYQILATYAPASEGNHTDGLTLLEDGFNAAPTGFSLPATCGSALSFPSVAMNTDALAIQSSGSQFAFDAAITNRGLALTTHYTITWTATNSGGIYYCGTTTNSPTCTIPADGTLAAETAYAYTVGLKLTCKSSIVWQDVTFRTFTYTAISTTTSTVGSVQTLTFTEPMSLTAKGDDNCENVLESSAQAEVGTGAKCTMPDTSSLKIEYGADYTIGAVTLNLNASGFDKYIVKSFMRGAVPSFALSGTTNTDKYEDYVNTWNVISEINTGGAALLYTWTYLSGSSGGPSLAGNLKSMIFNYWTMRAEQTYNIKVVQSDTSNVYFSYKKETGNFKILTSCTAVSCTDVTWTLSNDPGTIQSTTCTTGQGEGDIITCAKAHPGAYTIKATYGATSEGSNAGLDLLSTAFSPNLAFTLPSKCGSALSFPSVAMNTDALAIQSSGSQFAFDAAITNRGLALTTHYTITWTATNSGGIYYCGTTTNSPTCTIPADGTLAAETAYAYTVGLKLTCKSSIVWQDVTFRTFTYTAISTTTSTVGSVQTLTFTEPMSQDIALSDPGSDSCGNVLVSAEVADVGTGAKCTMPTPSTLQIEYGNGYAEGGDLVLKKEGMDKWITHTFAKPLLPTVIYTAPMEGTTINQDSGNIVITFSITTVGSPTWLFAWECTAGPECPTTALASQTSNPLDLATSNLKKGGSYTFKGTVRQSGVTNYLMTEYITVTFLILLKAQTQIGNTITIKATGHTFNLAMECATIFDVTNQGKLGVGASCTHTGISDTITIVLGDNTIFRSGSTLTLTKNQYFEDYSITIFNSGSFSSGATTMKGSLWYIPLAEVVTLKGGAVSTNCADYFVATPGMIDTTCYLESGGTEIVVRFASSDEITGKNTYTIDYSKFNKNIYGKHANEMPEFLPTMTNTSTPADGTTITQEDVETIIMTFSITAASTNAASGWTYSWTCAPLDTLANCPNMTGYTANPLNLPAADIRYGGNYTITGLVKQDDTTIYNMTKSFTFLFLIRMKTDTQIGNTIVLQSAGHLFNLTGTDCTVIFDGTDQAKLGEGATCTHVANSDTITIVLGDDTTLRSGSTLTLKKDQYFEDYPIPYDQPEFSIKFSDSNWNASLEDVQITGWDANLPQNIGVNKANMEAYNLIYKWRIDSSDTAFSPSALWTLDEINNNSSQAEYQITKNYLTPGVYKVSLELEIVGDATIYPEIEKSVRVRTKFYKMRQYMNHLWLNTTGALPDFSSCGDLFSTSTVNLLGTEPECLLQRHSQVLVKAKSDHNLVKGSQLLFKNVDIIGSKSLLLGLPMIEPTIIYSGDENTEDEGESESESETNLNKYFEYRVKANPQNIINNIFAERLLIFEWNITGISVNYAAVDGTGMGSELNILPKSLTEGEYKMLVQMSIEDMDYKVQKTLHFSIGRDPVIHLSGGNCSYKSSSNIVLSASNSTDPDNPGSTSNLRFKWECFSDRYLYKSNCPKDIFPSSQHNSSEINIQGGLIPINSTLYFKLTLSKKGLFESVDQVSVTIQGDNTGPLVKIIAIGSLNNAIDQKKQTHFEIEFLEGSEAEVTNYHWGTEPHVWKTHSSGKYFTLHKQSISIMGGSSLYVYCEVTDNTGTTKADIDIRVGNPPIMGNLWVAPTIPNEDIGLIDEFKIRAEDFRPREGKLLWYKYGFKLRGSKSEIMLTGWVVEKSELSTVLPIGRENYNYQIEVIVHVKNELGLSISKSRTLYVGPPTEPVDISQYLSGKRASTEETLTALGMICGLPEATPALIGQELQNLQGQELTSIEKNQLLQIAALVSEHSETDTDTSDTNTNTIFEDIVTQIVGEIKSGELEVIDTEPLYSLLSNTMEGQQKEGEVIDTSALRGRQLIDNSAFREREHKLRDNLLDVTATIVNTLFKGSVMETISTKAFAITATKRLGREMHRESLSMPGGATIQFSTDFEWGDEFDPDQYMAASIIELNTGPRYMLNNKDENGKPLVFYGNPIDLNIHKESGEIFSIKDLKDPLKLSIPIMFFNKSEEIEPSCVYYDEEIAQYVDTGIKTLLWSSEKISCQSDHASEFVVISRLVQPDPEKDYTYLQISNIIYNIYIVMIMLSTLSGILLVFYIYVFYKEYGNNVFSY